MKKKTRKARHCNSAVEIYKAPKGSAKGKWRARVKARNGKVLMVTGEGYVRLRDLRNCLELTKTLLRWP